MADVFISYKNEEFSEANWVRTTLETNGISCWMAPMCIPGGSSYAVEIPQAIRAARVFVLILSEECQLSKWVPRELDQAINEGKTILPFMLEDCPLRDDFNFYLSNIQRYAAYENKAAAIEKMIHEIRAILGTTNKTGDSEPVAAVQLNPVEDAPPAATEPSSTVEDRQKAVTKKGASLAGTILKWILAVWLWLFGIATFIGRGGFLIGLLMILQGCMACPAITKKTKKYARYTANKKWIVLGSIILWIVLVNVAGS